MRFSLFSAVLGVSLFAVGAARAEYSLCNKTSYTLDAAIGYVDAERLATRGWWRLRPGQCKIVLPDQIKPQLHFVYAESIEGHRGPLRAWSGETPLCVENDGFFNLRNQEVCRDDPARQRNFFDVQVTAAANGRWQTDFAEATVYSVYTAEIAGIQRLLQDVGQPVRAIDGSNDRETQRLVAGYKRQRGIPENAPAEELIDKLVEDANAREERLGLTFCNKTETAVWSALGQSDERGIYTSRGWWKLEPGDCSKVIKGAVSGDHVYVYGVIDDGPNERRLAGGDKALCTNAVKFDIANDSPCSEQEVDEANFRRFTISAGAATFDFTTDMFAAATARPAQRQAP
ncbi:MAG: DUF1036 domain-containing protein [Parvularculaceae bacterium]|nr:DUF1036 domain-containing protein [Parvularculaceae bacterium]